MLAICLVALGLRLRGLGDLTLWVDEAFTWANARGSLADLLSGRVHVHPPVYFLLERYAVAAFGSSEYALRLPGALLSVLAVPALWSIGNRLAGPRAGLIAALLIAVAPVAVAYAREARMYGLVMAESALLLAAAVWIVGRCDRRFSSSRPGSGSGRLGVYALMGVVGGLTHLTFLAPIAAGALWTLGARGPSRRWLVGHGAVLGVLAAWAAVFWSNREAWRGNVWLPWASDYALVQQVVDWATALAGLSVGPAALDAIDASTGARFLGAVLALGLAAAGAAALVARRRTIPALALVGLAVGPLAAILFLESVRPMWHVRFTLVGFPAAFVLMACAVAWLPWRLGGALIAVLALGPQLYGLASSPSEARDDWRSLAREVRRDAKPDHVVLGGVQALAGYYLEPVVAVHQRPVALGRAADEVVAELDQRVGAADTVWLIPARDPLLDRDDLIGSVLGRYANARTEQTIGGIQVARLDLRHRERIALSPMLHPVDASFGGAIRLLGYLADVRPDDAEAAVALSLDIQVDQPLTRDYKLFAHALNAEGRTVAQRDVVLVDPFWRTTREMPPGSRVRLELQIAGASGDPRDVRAVGVGFYDEATGERLPLHPAAPEHRLVLSIENPGG